jgi:2-hydroxy-3-keto-5-methylthiopentenyl-1-phosphate phosphatase
MSTESAKPVDHLIFQNGRWYKPTNDANDIGDYLTAWISKSELHDELFGDGANKIFAASEFGVTVGVVGGGDGPFYVDGLGRARLNNAFIGENDIVSDKIEIHAADGAWSIRKNGDVTVKPNGWIVVRLDSEPETRAFYHQSKQEALAAAKMLSSETGKEWRVYRRTS